MDAAKRQAGPGALSGPALIAALEGLASLPDNLRRDAAREVARQLMAGYGGEAVNVALRCQNAFLERGEDVTAAQMLEVLTAIWAIEDSGGAGN
ncbi:MAG: hypothetical protein QM698_05095 [Micropepsaceae bacterium]